MLLHRLPSRLLQIGAMCKCNMKYILTVKWTSKSNPSCRLLIAEFV